MKIELIKTSKLESNIGQISGLPKNPRIVKDRQYRLLLDSIRESPEMLELRELIVFPLDGDKYVVIAGNMRFRACQECKHKTIPCKVLDKNTPVKKLVEYALKDNSGYGEWDYDILANEFEELDLLAANIDFPATSPIRTEEGDDKVSDKDSEELNNKTVECPECKTVFAI